MILPFLGHPDIYSSPLFNIKHLEALIFGILGFGFILISTKFLKKKNKSPWFLLALIFGALVVLLLVLKFFIPLAFDNLISSFKAINLGMVPLKNARELISEMALFICF
jgi:hypothetical protein